MSDDSPPRVQSVASLAGVRLIDGGDTIAMSFRAPDGSETAILIPRGPASSLEAHLRDVLAQRVRSIAIAR